MYEGLGALLAVLYEIISRLGAFGSAALALIIVFGSVVIKAVNEFRATRWPHR